jgi:DNA polymerase III gamma/tau subunit
MSLYQKHRPTKFDEMLGSPSTIKVLSEMVRKGKVPHFLLFTGGSGTGKTTAARILASELGAQGIDYREMNSASYRGIETIRQIQDKLNIAPAMSKCRVYFMDECFAAGTLVTMGDGSVLPIERIKIGDWVRGVGGNSRVKAVFQNGVSLQRLCLIRTTDGREVLTTTDHLFLTKTGWIAATMLSGRCILSIRGYPMNHENIRLPVVRKDISGTIKEPFKVLLAGMLDKFGKRAKGLGEVCDRVLSSMREKIHASRVPPENVLFPLLRVQGSDQSSGGSGETLQSPSRKEHFNSTQEVCENSKRKGVLEKAIVANDSEPSDTQAGCSGKGDGDETNQWDTPHLEREKRGQWSTYPPTEEVVEDARSGMGDGDSSADRDQGTRNSIQLQVGHRQRGVQSRSGGGWSWASLEKSYIAGQEKDGGPQEVRVESVEIYKRGHNEELFQSRLKGQDVLWGVARFYDLEIDGHPSYTANGFVVHNCHALSRDALEAANKMLEDTPPHVYFFWATSEPQKLPKATLTRGSPMVFSAIPDGQIEDLVESVAHAEGIKLGPGAVDAIRDSAEGSGRMALVLLENVSHLSPKEQADAVESARAEQTETKEICQALMTEKPWSTVANIIKNLKSDPENVRRAVLGYARNTLLNDGRKKRAHQMLLSFEKNFYDSGTAGLTLACYEVVNP